jgi:hypothetical protein
VRDRLSDAARRCPSSWPSSSSDRGRAGGAAVEPALELRERDEDAASAADDAEFADHVLVEVIAANPEHAGCLVRTECEPRTQVPPVPLMLRFAGDWLPEALDRNDIELKLMRANLPRHFHQCSIYVNKDELFPKT